MEFVNLSLCAEEEDHDDGQGQGRESFRFVLEGQEDNDGEEVGCQG